MGKLKAVGSKRLEGFHQGVFNGEAVKAYTLALINGKGKGVNIISLPAANQFGQLHQNAANKLASSVQFYQARDSVVTQKWKQHIVGQKLTDMHTSGGSDYAGGYAGISDKIEIQLRRDGRFIFYANSHSSFDSSDGMGYAHGNENNSAIYNITTPGSTTYLNLTFDNGDVAEYALTSNAEEYTLLNQRRYFVTELSACY